MVREVLETVDLSLLKDYGGEERLNMTLLALNLSNYVNGVAKRHQEISAKMFTGYEIHAITNGVHSYTWTGGKLPQTLRQVPARLGKRA